MHSSAQASSYSHPSCSRNGLNGRGKTKTNINCISSDYTIKRTTTTVITTTTSNWKTSSFRERMRSRRSRRRRRRNDDLISLNHGIARSLDQDHHQRKEFDVVTLGNMCVDVFHRVDKIPTKDVLKTREYLDYLLIRTREMRELDAIDLEVGGNTNFLIAASRLGLRAMSLGAIGEDFYGEFMKDVLIQERVRFQSYEEKEISVTTTTTTTNENTLVCFVLVDGAGSHAFCSSYDLGPWPLLADKYKLGSEVKEKLRKSKALFLNGFAFDELPPNDVVEAADIIHKHDGAVFFDPGPRAFTFHETDLRKKALISLIKRTDVVLATAEELAALVEHPNPNEELLQNPRSLAYTLFNHPEYNELGNLEWIVVKLGPDGAVLFSKNDQSIDNIRIKSPQVTLGDTVGCGDSAASAIVLGFLEMKKLKKTTATTTTSATTTTTTSATTSATDMQLSAKATLALATAVGAATASRTGAGRNVATKALAEKLLQIEKKKKNENDESGMSTSSSETIASCEYSEALQMLKRYSYNHSSS